MDASFYLDKFQKAADQLDKKKFHTNQIEIAVGVVLDSVFLKLYKKSWASPLQDPLTAESRIFFSVWINDSTIAEQKIFYNIHAFKLRQLKGYSIQSRKFAELFRADFKNFEHKWKNVSVDFGPLTLMEGWLKIDLENFQDDILKLANGFLEIEHLVDNTLVRFK
ncbi:MAG: hypothetical protein JWP12_861 [Bacteroidetes bacterium]|nr:hypothetical protein [Bacteroidota bacterium]